MSQKISAHPIKRIIENRVEAKKSVVYNTPGVFTKIADLDGKSVKKISDSLKETLKCAVDELESAKDEGKQLDEDYAGVNKEIQESLEEEKRYKELYFLEIRKNNDLRKYIQQQKSIRRFKDMY